MSVRDLADVVPAPKHPVHAGDDAAWQRACRAVGVQFPDDYRDYCKTYGSGAFLGGEIHILNPFDPSFVDEFAARQERIAHFHSEYDMPYPAFPTSPGVIQLGGDGLGNELLYLARPAGESWAIVTVEHESEADAETYELSLTDFLAKAFRRKLDTNIWNKGNYFKKGYKTNFTPSKV